MLFIAVILFNLFNYSGLLYPDYVTRHGHNLSIAERSNEYVASQDLVQEATALLEERGSSYTIYADVFYAYYLTYVANGYVSSAPGDLRPMSALDGIITGEGPELSGGCAYIAPISAAGAERFLEFVAAKVADSGSYELTLFEEFRSGDISLRVMQLAPSGANCP